MARKIGDFIGKAVGILLLVGLASCLAPKEAPEVPEADEPPAITAEAVTRGLPASVEDTEPADTDAEEEAARKAAEEEAARLAAEEEAARKAAEEEAARLAAEEKARQEEAARLAAEEQARQEEAARKAAEEEAARLAAEERARQEEAARKAAAEEQARREEAARQAASNFDTYDNPEQQKTTDTYVLNTSTKKVHKPTCRDVKKIAPQNYATSSETMTELEGRGYSPCGHCNPR